VWLSAQYQFEDYWERGENWDYTVAALKGSSISLPPRVLQWLSGNTGFHHIHHRVRGFQPEHCHT
jgi:omega-6 fatty acid desaturase (delta-12 desaturase)